MNTDEPEPTRVASHRRKRQRAWHRMLPFGLISVVALAVYLSPLRSWFGFRQFISHWDSINDMLEIHFLTALGTYIAVYILVVAFSLPIGLILTFLGGVFFGWLAGGLAAIIGATIGAGIIFAAARFAFADLLRGKAGPWLQKFSAGLEKNVWSYLFFLRLTPVFPFWLVNIAPAFFNVAIPAYLVSTFFGIMPGTFAYALAGSGLREVFAAQVAAFQECEITSPDPESCTISLSLENLLSPTIIAAMFALGLVALIPIVYRRFTAYRST